MQYITHNNRMQMGRLKRYALSSATEAGRYVASTRNAPAS